MAQNLTQRRGAAKFCGDWGLSTLNIQLSTNVWFHKRQGHDFRRAITGGGSQCQLGPDLICSAANITERKISPERWRFYRAGDVTDFLATVEKFVAALWLWQPRAGGVRQAQTPQFLRDVAEAVDAINDFLPDIAAFVVAHGALFDAAFEWQVRVVHVRAKARDARLDARGFERLPAGGASADGFGSADELVHGGGE